MQIFDHTLVGKRRGGKKGVSFALNVLEYQSNSQRVTFVKEAELVLSCFSLCLKIFTEIMVQFTEKSSQKDQMVDFEKETLR